MSSDVYSDLTMCGYGKSSSGSKRVVATSKDYVICCIFHNEKTPSLSIKKDATMYNCYGCGASGSYKKLRALLLPELYSLDTGLSRVMQESVKLSGALTLFDNAQEDAEKALGRVGKLNKINTFENNIDIMVPWTEDWRGLPGSFLESYGAKRWISKELDYLEEQWLEVPRIYFPFKHRKNNLTVGYAARLLDDETFANQPKYRNSSLIATKEILYLISAIQPFSPIVIVEGAVDALKLMYNGIPAIAALGTNQWSDVKTRLVISKRPSAVICMGDGDKAGRGFNNQMYEIFKYVMEDKFYVIELPDGLDPGGFNMEWLHFVYNKVNEASNNFLENRKNVST